MPAPPGSVVVQCTLAAEAIDLWNCSAASIALSLLTYPSAQIAGAIWNNNSSGSVSPQPTASNLNFVPGQTVANLVMVKVGTDGKVKIYNAAGQVHVIFDVVGYFE